MHSKSLTKPGLLPNCSSIGVRATATALHWTEIQNNRVPVFFASTGPTLSRCELRLAESPSPHALVHLQVVSVSLFSRSWWALLTPSSAASLLFLSVQDGVVGYTRSDFPQDFVFGAATSAYQYEGAATEDGRSPGIWDTFAHAGKMKDKSTGDVAADGYHKYKGDVKLMAETGLDGRGAVNQQGLKYYNNVIDELAERASKTDPPTGQHDPTQYPSDPQGFQLTLEYLKESYGDFPIYIEENGKYSFQYRKGSRNDSLDDADRVDYIKGHIGGILNAIRNGVNVRGYFAWSFVDVFELLSGYQTRYGLYRVDFDDEARPRRARRSARWYSDFLKNKQEPVLIAQQ
ncbi:hypothetical protein E2562_013490 [Oryza meyeriana var. granulata]|uniref:4-hydroxy-7-methoxy-3-oxo-3,4-dihydro-2H-1,4-benzoxazin-2-yl glucosidebeta-D-glucosidase n=1 Tax=Oryza meyeriana var. granulata TaxID=110450 RepID=A0A6G1BWD7_9ORYZ|nr:hypothetical protein E2562_013490 [Oryza meyeriana var. granulata]